jgi:pimeloyl-ACP methyl ester carboxylesterase
MTIVKKIRILCFVFCSLYGLPLFAQTPTILLVHGALFTSNIWSSVQANLQQKGYQVVTVDTPGRLSDGVSAEAATLNAAVEKVCGLARLQTEPVIMVGHNQAGAIITQATASCGNQIAGLVYIAAVVPLPGERPFDVLSDQDNKNFDLVAPLDTVSGLSIPDPNAPIQQLLMADATKEAAQLAIQNMVPEPIIFAYDTLDYDAAAFQSIPKYYVRTTDDVMISPQSQDKFLRRQPMEEYILHTGHCPFISQPDLLAQILDKIAKNFSV